MQTKLEFILTQRARSYGGDRYEAKVPGEPKNIVVYVPQFISREGQAEPREKITVTFEID